MASLLWLPVIGWLVSPIITFFVNKLLSDLDFHLSRRLRELELQIIPSLEQILGIVTEQRMLSGAKDERNGSESHLQALGELAKDLKCALYDAEDVLDLVKYHRNQKKVLGDGVSLGNSIRSSVLQVIGDHISGCKQSWFGQKLWQCVQNQNEKLRYLGAILHLCAENLDIIFWDLLAKLQQYAQYRNQMFRDLPLRGILVQCAQSLPLYIHQGAGQPSMPDEPSARSATEFRDDIEQATTPSLTPDDAPSNLPSPNAPPNSTGDNQHGPAEEASLGQIALDFFSYVFSRLHSIYLAVRRLRDWSCVEVGIKNDDGIATNWVLSINEIISLRKRIKNIEYIVSESKKSRLLNQNCSSIPEDADKESSSSCTVKNSAGESTGTKKEIHDIYRSLQKKVFGRDKERANISRMLRKGPDTYAAGSSTNKPYSVIGIYGITGSGKSTLAQYVCDYEKDDGHFDPIMFIHVGKTFSVGNIFRDMLEQITHSRPPNDEGPKSLKTKFEETLKDKCFLLVLDDLWVNDDNQMEREILLDTLSAALSGSRVLVTAQKTDAAQALGAEEQISVPDLNEEVYLSLFMHHALPDASDDDGEYRRIGSKIVNRLSRSPIAAVTVGKQLQRNKSISFWETTANLDVLNRTMGALWWSYQQLGVDVRRCFTYCSVFPKGYLLERDELVQMWIAQGFVSTWCNAAVEPEDIGHHYFDELVTFSFLQVQSTSFGMVVFTIHDLLHELAERVSGSEFFRFGLNGSPEDIPEGVHHLHIEIKNLPEINERILELGNLHTLIIEEDHSDWEEASRKTKERKHMLEEFLGRLFMRLTKLRVLITKLICFPIRLSVPASIDQMKHLRYLGFNFPHDLCHLILPSTFSKLYHLQVIDVYLAGTSCPEDMTNLICLRHISGKLYFPNIGRLTSLQTLKLFEVKEAQRFGLKQLKQLNKLRGTLTIQGLEIVGSKKEALEADLPNKELLRDLTLKFGRVRRFGSDVEAEVLEGLCPPKDLEELLIIGYKGLRYPTWMSSRGHPDTPKQLHTLELRSCRKLATIPEGSEFFIGLRELTIDECDWDSLPENMESLQSLQTLEIFTCPNMELLPKLPVQSLKKIIIKYSDMLIMTCKEEGHENWCKIQQIPEKDIGGEI